MHTSLGFSKPIHEERPMRVITIGAGASGLLMAYKLQRNFAKFEHVVYEKNTDLGGTWFENKYPGCACDFPAHTYTWSFEPNPTLSSVYASAAEIFQYFKNFSAKYGLDKYIKYNHTVSGAFWNDKEARWEVEIANAADGTIIKDYADILINAAGLLNNWKWPDIIGLETYKGKLVHSAHWDQTVDLNGKHIGLIGNGSSGIQILPVIRDQVDKITTFIRSPTWISPAFTEEQHIYTEEERNLYDTNPEALLKYRKSLETTISSFWPIFIADSDTQKAAAMSMSATMKGKLRNEGLEDLVIPTWGVGCRRITPGVDYLETLASDKVKVVYGDIEKITEKGVVGSDGEEHLIDVLICATGFNASFRPSFPITGTIGETLAEVWKDEPKGYLGIAAYGFPNYFMFVGPNSPIANGPLLAALEAQADYFLKMMDRWQTENIHSFQPKLEAVNDFAEHRDKFMRGTVWDQGCPSWYKKNGKIIGPWPGSSMHYLEAVAQPRFDDWDFRYIGNRFAYLGNGYSQAEVEPDTDWAYYIRNSDDAPFLSRSKRRKAVSHAG